MYYCITSFINSFEWKMIILLYYISIFMGKSRKIFFLIIYYIRKKNINLLRNRMKKKKTGKVILTHKIFSTSNIFEWIFFFITIMCINTAYFTYYRVLQYDLSIRYFSGEGLPVWPTFTVVTYTFFQKIFDDLLFCWSIH